MKSKLLISLILIIAFLPAESQEHSPDFRWGNGYFYNLNTNDSLLFNKVAVKLLKVENHYNLLKIGADTLWLKVARRSVPLEIHGIRIYVADNKAVSALNPDSPVHGLLQKDALICLSELSKPLLDNEQYIFPVSFNNGFSWNAEEDSYTFSFYRKKDPSITYISYPGIGFNLHDARGLQKHWLVAIENSRVVWVENQNPEQGNNPYCVLLESESQPGIYYIYRNLYRNNLVVKQGQKLVKGDAVGTAWGDNSWGHLQFAVIKSNVEPTYDQCFGNIINGFPQLFELYFRQSAYLLRSFTRGKITFGGLRHTNGNQLNTQEFEPYSGKGWITGKWNPADKVEWIGKGSEGNARLKKVLFEGTPAQQKNPVDYYEYHITVRNGLYRIRAKVGDALMPSWQKIEFEGFDAGIKNLEAGDYSWTGEKIVRVTDGIINIRLYIDPENKKVAGLSEIVFQAAD